jgi:hypothetical protein
MRQAALFNERMDMVALLANIGALEDYTTRDERATKRRILTLADTTYPDGVFYALWGGDAIGFTEAEPGTVISVHDARVCMINGKSQLLHCALWLTIPEVNTA